MPEISVNLGNGTFGNEFQVQRLDQFFKQHLAQSLQTEREAQRVEFFLMIGSVHGRNPCRDMPLMIDILKKLRFLAGQNPGFQRV